MPEAKPDLSVNCMIDKLPVKSARVTVSKFDFQGDYWVFATHRHRLNKAKSYHKRRSHGNGVLIERYR